MKQDYGWALKEGIELWPHQVVTYQERLKHARFNDWSQWGTGKSLPCTAALFRRMAEGRVFTEGSYSYKRGLKRNALVVTTPSAYDGWRDTFDMFSLKCAPIIDYFGSRKHRKRCRDRVLDFNSKGIPVILFCSWGLFQSVHTEGDISWIGECLKPHYFVADEAQYISGVGCKRETAFTSLIMYPSIDLDFPQVDLLTATPITNGEHKAWTYFYLAHQDQKTGANQAYPGGQNVFETSHFQQLRGGESNIKMRKLIFNKDRERFEKVFSTRSVLHNLADVIKDRKEPVYTTATFDMGAEQESIYNYFETYLEYRCEEEGVEIQGRSMAKFTRLRQIASDPGCCGLKADDTKLNTLMQILTDMGCHPGGLKAVIVVEFRFSWAKIKQALEAAGYKCVGVQGGMSTTKRRTMIKQFQDDPTTQIFIGNRDAMAEGVNLQVSSVLINYELGVKADKYSQADHRVDRAGQKNKPTILTMLARSSIDVRTYRTLQKRLNRSDNLSENIALKTKRKRRELLDSVKDRIHQLVEEDLAEIKTIDNLKEKKL